MDNKITITPVTPKKLRPKSNGRFIDIDTYFNNLSSKFNHDYKGGFRNNGD